jgi:hypothetical protein
MQIEGQDDTLSHRQDGSAETIGSILRLLRPTSDAQQHVKRLAQEAVAQGPGSVAQLLTARGCQVEECTSRQVPSAAQWLQSLQHTFLLCTVDGAPLAVSSWPGLGAPYLHRAPV